MPDRPKKLYFNAPIGPDGRPEVFYAFAPARDLDEQEVAGFTDEQYDQLVGETPQGLRLYQPTEPSARRKARSEGRSGPEPTPVSPQPTPAELADAG